MAHDHDALLLESTRVHRARLRAAYLHGDILSRRTTNDNIRRLIGSFVVAAVISAGCAGFSFVKANIGSMRGAVSTPAAPTAPIDPATPSTPSRLPADPTPPSGETP